MRFLLVNAYPREGRAALERVGATQPDVLYRRMLDDLLPEPSCDVLCPADPDAALPAGAALADFAGIVWSGSSLTIHDERDARVRRQIEFVRTAYRQGVPSFGSCWAAQIAVTAAGGQCAANPKGREFGITAPIELTEHGVAHPLFRDKAGPFVALTSHADEIVALPPGAQVLATNAFSRVQAVAVEHGRGTFWAVQYHPEFDLYEIARLCVLRADELVRQGTFATHADAVAYAHDLERLARRGGDTELARRRGADSDDLSIARRSTELRNWIEALVMPRRNGLRSGDVASP